MQDNVIVQIAQPLIRRFELWHWPGKLIGAFWLALGVAPLAKAAEHYSPDHPTVIAMVDKAVKFLVSSRHHGPDATNGREVLASYAIMLGQSDSNHPRILSGIQEAKRLIRRAMSGQYDSEIVYAVSISAVLLANHDPVEHRPALEDAVNWLESKQRPYGGFGYLTGNFLQTGDISQTQYASMALWTLNKVGIPVKEETAEGIVNFLRATQDPSGAWGYQAILPNGKTLVSQEQVSKSLGTAGISGLLMAADILHLFGRHTEKDEDEIPSAFKRVDIQQGATDRGKPSTVTRGDIEDTLKNAFLYQEKSPPQGRSWYYYWRYGQERYETFRGLAESKNDSKSDWYDLAVEEFKKKQGGDGAWTDGASSDPYVDTAFAVLFLVRSTKRTLGKTDEGLAFGGYELPKDITNVRMIGDRIVSEAEMSVESMLEVMEDVQGTVTEGMLPRNMQLSSDPKTRAAQTARLSRLLSSKSPTARQLAARLLGRSEEIQVAPDLIYALMDPDPYVPQIAEEGLRLLSRKLNAVLLKADPTNDQRVAAVNYWKAWYLGLRPDYVFTPR